MNPNDNKRQGPAQDQQRPVQPRPGQERRQQAPARLPERSCANQPPPRWPDDGDLMSERQSRPVTPRPPSA